jgi:hypothetical protein
MTWYITIRSDDRYSVSIETTRLITFLSTIPTLQQTSPVTFGKAIESPWVEIILAKCDDRGGYGSCLEYIPTANVVELFCSYVENIEWYEHLACQIAMFLGWDAWQDSEERQIFSKTKIDNDRSIL